MGGVQNSSGNSGGVGGLFYWSKNGNSGEEGGGLREIPSVVGVWIFSGTTHCRSHSLPKNQLESSQRTKIKFSSASSNPVGCLASPNTGDFAMHN